MGRRAPGEGAAWHRSDGRWEGRLDLGYIDGKRRRKAVYGNTKADVIRQLRAMADQRDKGTLSTQRDVRLSDFLRSWLESSEHSLRPKTYVTYKMYAENHIRPSLGHVFLRKLTPDHVQTMMNRKMADGLAAQSVVHIRAILRRALNRAIRLGLVTQNVAALADPPKVERREVNTLTVDQAKRLVIAMRGDRLRGLYLLAVLTGLRQGELLGMRWQDVDFGRSLVNVTVALQRQNGELRLVPPKTAKSRRAVALTGWGHQVLKQRWVAQEEERWVAGSRWVDTGLVFTSRHGTPLESGNVLRAFKGLLRKAGVPQMRFHDLRHSCATLLVAAGVPPRIVMEILGHSQISLTMNTYTHVSVELQREALAKLDEMLRDAPDQKADDGPAGAAAR